MSHLSLWRGILSTSAICSLLIAGAACSSDDDAKDAPAPHADAGAPPSDSDASEPLPTFTVSASVTGLTGSGLVLQLNAGDELPVSSDGTVTFPTALPASTAFAVTVKTQPSSPTQLCTVTNGAGTIQNANVTAQVACIDTSAISGHVSGMKGSGLVLNVNGAALPAIDHNGAFEVGRFEVGTAYEVTIASQPTTPSATCRVTNGRGTTTADGFASVYVECGGLLIVHAAEFFVSDVVTKLTAASAFATVDAHDGNASTPTAAQLGEYSAVLAFADDSFANGTALGDALASYVDAGGRVVVAPFANVNGEVSGRWYSEGYNLFEMADQRDDSIEAPLQIEEPSSPLMIGVSTLTASSAFRTEATTANGAVVVARWGDGVPLVVRGEKNGKKRAELNFYPPSSDARNDFWQGDGVALMINALLYQ